MYANVEQVKIKVKDTGQYVQVDAQEQTRPSLLKEQCVKFQSEQCV